MPALAIILPAVLAPAVVGWLLILGLAKGAAKRTPAPGDTPSVAAPMAEPSTVSRRRIRRDREVMRQQLARADYN